MTELELTRKQELIVGYMRENPGALSPTSIGMGCAEPYHRASSWACSGLKALVERNIVTRHQNGTYELANPSPPQEDR